MVSRVELSRPQKVKTPVGEVRARGYVFFHHNGAIKIVRLFGRTMIKSSWGKLKVKEIVFFVNGGVKGARLAEYINI